MYRHTRFALLSLAVALVLATGFTHPAQAGTIASSGDLPLSGTFYDSVTGENVVITGTLHLETLVTISPTDPQYIIFGSVSGTGTGTSGLSYGFTGVNLAAFPTPPSKTITPLHVVLNSVAYQTGDVENPLITGMTFNATFTFANDGKLILKSSTVTVLVPCIGD